MLLNSNKSWFSIIEILVGMFIFSLWIISVFSLLSSSVRINEYNKNYIIAANLAREQLELLRFNRDYNYEVLQKFDQINPHGWDYTKVLSWSTYYTVQNNVSWSTFPVDISEISSTDFVDDKNYQLCLENDMYVYCLLWTGVQETPFYKYIYVDRTLWNNKLKITSKVIWKSKWTHEFEVKTILADWKQL